MYTVYSSFIFGTAAIHLLHAGETVQFYLFFVLVQLSLFNHALQGRAFRGKRLFILADQGVIALAIVNGASRTMSLMNETSSVVPLLMYAPPCAWMAFVYSGKSWLPGNAWKPWHATIHLGIGLAHHAVLAWLQQQRQARFAIQPT